MNKDPIILRILIAILGAAIISMIAYEIVYDRFSILEITEPELIFVIADKKCSELSGVPIVSLQDLSRSSDSIAKISQELKEENGFSEDEITLIFKEGFLAGILDYFSFFSGVTE